MPALSGNVTLSQHGRPINFDGQVVLITGAGRGLGRAYALAMAERGAAIMVHDAGVDRDGRDSDHTVAERVVDEIKARAGVAQAAFYDLSDWTAGAELVDETIAQFGRLDVVIHNAGIAVRGGVQDLDDEAWWRSCAVNGHAAFAMLQRALPAMYRHEYGRVVLTLSGHALYSRRGDDTDLVAYAAGKAMQFGLLNALAQAGVERNVLVNAVSPVAATRMLTDPSADRRLSPDHVVPAVLYLASDRCEHTGSILRAAGGRFSAGYYAVSGGVDFGPTPTSPEELAHRWPEVSGGRLKLP